MAIRMASRPASVTAALEEGLPRFATAASRVPDAPASALESRSIRPSIGRRDPAMAQSLQAALRDGPDAGLGAPVVVLGLDQLMAGADPRDVAPAVWAQLLPEGAEGGRAMAEVDTQSGTLAAVTEGATVKRLGKRIERLASSEAPGGPDRELSLIRVPALHLEALWLKGDAGEADDIVIPGDGPIAPLEPGRRYKLAEFRTIVQQMAGETLAHTRDDDMGG